MISVCYYILLCKLAKFQSREAENFKIIMDYVCCKNTYVTQFVKARQVEIYNTRTIKLSVKRVSQENLQCRN